jgi:hypothetical protein
MLAAAASPNVSAPMRGQARHHHGRGQAQIRHLSGFEGPGGRGPVGALVGGTRDQAQRGG